MTSYTSGNVWQTRVGVIRATMWSMAGEATLSEGERLVLRLHPHWKTLLRPILLLALIVAAALALLIFLSPHDHAALIRLGIGAAALVATMIWFVVPLLRWSTTSYELTTRRLRLRKARWEE